VGVRTPVSPKITQEPKGVGGYNSKSRIDAEAFFKVIGNHVRCKSTNVWDTVKGNDGAATGH